MPDRLQADPNGPQIGVVTRFLSWTNDPVWHGSSSPPCAVARPASQAQSDNQRDSLRIII
jgi:hypothetical protein